MKAEDEVQEMQAGALRLDAKQDDGQPGQPTATAQPGAGEDEPDVKAALDRGDARGAVMLCARDHGEAIGRLCMALLGSQADAEDVLQETLLDAYRGIAGGRGEGSLRSWLFGIARRKCAREAERGARKRTAAPALSSRRVDGAREALGELRPSEREAVVLRFGAGLSFREVADACGIDEAAARKRVSRGIAALRSRLVDEA
jgi:RNA polymerase sigma-70 factor, ECF subfamily